MKMKMPPHKRLMAPVPNRSPHEDGLPFEEWRIHPQFRRVPMETQSPRSPPLGSLLPNLQTQPYQRPHCVLRHTAEKCKRHRVATELKTPIAHRSHASICSAPQCHNKSTQGAFAAAELAACPMRVAAIDNAQGVQAGRTKMTYRPCRTGAANPLAQALQILKCTSYPFRRCCKSAQVPQSRCTGTTNPLHTRSKSAQAGSFLLHTGLNTTLFLEPPVRSHSRNYLSKSHSNVTELKLISLCSTRVHLCARVRTSVNIYIYFFLFF